MLSKTALNKMAGILLLGGVVTLSGCSLTTPSAPKPAAQPVQPAAQPVQPAEQEPVRTTAPLPKPELQQPSGQISPELSMCVKELDSLKTISPKDYSQMVAGFSEISQINRLYRQLERTASPDTLKLLKMSIEAKTKVMCAQVRYYSVLSIENTLEKVNGL
ncbi:hypothetical protein H8R13_14275 [Morganella morganii]|uniref:SPOR domain-containing protein n=1 Tax=Morganella morganii TaxID=582 RepID=UPI00164A90D8|nr:hypothetical protein [Morganella morganii]MBC4012889.1 hypothetical protein [Morganella morganii]MCF1267211.1 hypothetical protein [Morganella morganii]